MNRKSKITASELMAQLKSDPRFVTNQRAKEEQRLRREEEFRKAEGPIVAELRHVGFAVQSAWDLVNTPASYPKAVPVLLAHLQREYPGPIREGLARALAVPEGRSGWDQLVHLYANEIEPRVKDGLAVALAGSVDESVLDQLIDLAKDTRHGPSRLLLLRALERAANSNARAHATLGELASDPDLKKEIAFILRRVRKTKVTPEST